MIVVLDTSCISTFIRIGEVELLLRIIGKNKAVITQQIAHELRLSKMEILKKFKHPRIQIRDAESTITLKYGIHIGEASVIMFAKAEKGIAVIDDKKAREVAEKEGVDFIGTATLIRLGVESGIIKKNELENLLERIVTEGKLYLNKEVREWILK